jgi:hypothetical protein
MGVYHDFVFDRKNMNHIHNTPFHFLCMDRWVILKILDYLNPVACARNKRVNRSWAEIVGSYDRAQSFMTVLNHPLTASEIRSHKIGFGVVCYYGDLLGVQYYLKRDKNWDYGMFNACYGGHSKIVDLMIAQGARSFEQGLYYACAGGQLTLVKRMFDCGVNKIGSSMVVACKNGHTEVVRMLLSWGFKCSEMCFTWVCAGGHCAIAQLLIDSGIEGVGRLGHFAFHASKERAWRSAETPPDATPPSAPVYLMFLERGLISYKQALLEACLHDLRPVVQMIIKQGYTDFAESLPVACCHGRYEIVKMMLESVGGYLGDPVVDGCLELACRSGHLNVVRLLIEKGDKDIDWDLGLRGACESGNRELVDLMIAHGATYWNRGLRHAITSAHYAIAEMMLDHGANDWEVLGGP